MSFWYPFRSREVKEIVSHLTPEEHSSLRALAKRDGGWFGLYIAGPGAVLTVLAHNLSERFSHSYATLIGAGIFGAFFVVAGIISRPIRARQKAFLCATEHAKQAGYNFDSLPMFGFGW